MSQNLKTLTSALKRSEREEQAAWKAYQDAVEQEKARLRESMAARDAYMAALKESQRLSELWHAKFEAQKAAFSARYPGDGA